MSAGTACGGMLAVQSVVRNRVGGLWFPKIGPEAPSALCGLIPSSSTVAAKARPHIFSLSALERPRRCRVVLGHSATCVLRLRMSAFGAFQTLDCRLEKSPSGGDY